MRLIEQLLLKEEGLRHSVYTDSLGYATIGVGRMVDARKGGKITTEEAFFLLRNDIAEREAFLLAAYPWYSGLSDVRRAVILSMAFQLGTTGLAAFRNTLQAVAEGRFGDAADGILRSKWASQTPARAPLPA